jgi:hypothetical protein
MVAVVQERKASSAAFDMAFPRSVPARTLAAPPPEANGTEAVA